MHLYRLGELNLVLLNRYSLIRVPINESLLYSQLRIIHSPLVLYKQSLSMVHIT